MRVHVPWLELDPRRFRRELEKVHLRVPELSDLASHELHETVAKRPPGHPEWCDRQSQPLLRLC